MSLFDYIKKEDLRKKQIEHRFWKKTRKQNGCLVWTGHREPAGYGVYRTKESTSGAAHRYAYCFANKLELKDIVGWYICHTCDNPPCVKPEHLYKGTAKDNARDRMVRQRYTPRGKIREIGYMGRKLTEEEVRQIRKESAGGESFRYLGEKYRVAGKHTISDIVKRKSWAWVED